MVYCYILTINRTAKTNYTTLDQLLEQREIAFSRWPAMIYSTMGVEIGQKYRNLHMHILVFSNRCLHFTKEMCCSGDFHYHFKRIKDYKRDLSNVVSYIHKNDWQSKYKLDEILLVNYSNYHYLFDSGYKCDRATRQVTL